MVLSVRSAKASVDAVVVFVATLVVVAFVVVVSAAAAFDDDDKSENRVVDDTVVGSDSDVDCDDAALAVVEVVDSSSTSCIGSLSCSSLSAFLLEIDPLKLILCLWNGSFGTRGGSEAGWKSVDLGICKRSVYSHTLELLSDVTLCLLPVATSPQPQSRP